MPGELQSGAYECFICKTRLKTSRALRKHLTAQHTEQYSCKGCPFVTRNRGVAREHEKWHAGTKYQCPHCASEFDKLTTYMGHIRIKHVSDFVCELCGYTFVSKKGIDVHKKKKHRLVDKTLTLEGPYCEMCDVTFISEEAHERHLKLSARHSSDHDPNRIRNDSQSMNTERNGRVMRRIERRPVIHPRSTLDREPHPPVNCEQCGIQLRDLRVYAQHFRRAHPDKNRTKYPAMKTPCMCEQCGKIFQLTLEGPYCEMCDVTFISEEAHERHLKLSARHSSDHDPNRIRNDSQSMNTERNGRVMRRIERRPVIHPRATLDREPHPPVNCEQCHAAELRVSSVRQALRILQ
ncbi:hypothetical protein B5X24_HaOG213594 [Helicoverpa armigera]|uniref:C2H2-type domain-containing protein n=1 Tax=Helicoverpa armigera TaxID=29058 RepID=A0A2W1BI44_HELAM|nr:hypothetical protein B5X24_HaOG213594 [Helicoverpa armigera]